MYYKVNISGVNTDKLTVLTNDKNIELINRLKDGDISVREQIINGNLKLVLRCIQRFRDKGDSPDDLFQIGCVGLIKSINNFDTSYGVRFSTYAVPMNVHRRKRVFMRVCGIKKTSVKDA